MFFHPKKKLGQNFLIDKNIINKIVKLGNLDEKKIVLEIGPGYGNLTKKIIENKPQKIIAIEKDKNLALFLKNDLKNYNKINILNDDFLKIMESFSSEKNIIIFGNLPYNISTKILVDLIMLKKWPPWYEKLIFMFQKEVADRIIAKEGSKDFGRLSVLCNWRLDIKKHFNVSRNCFFPKPKINSSLLSFKPKKINKYNIKDPKNLEIITRVLFSSRRKMINKSFFKLFGKNYNLIKKLNIDLNKRPAELSNEMFYKITVNYEKLLN